MIAFTDDYSSTTVTQVFDSGNGNTAFRCITVFMLDDTLVESDEIFNIKLTLLTTGSNIIADNTETAVTIFDNDG